MGDEISGSGAAGSVVSTGGASRGGASGGVVIRAAARSRVSIRVELYGDAKFQSSSKKEWGMPNVTAIVPHSSLDREIRAQRSHKGENGYRESLAPFPSCPINPL